VVKVRPTITTRGVTPSLFPDYEIRCAQGSGLICHRRRSPMDIPRDQFPPLLRGEGGLTLVLSWTSAEASYQPTSTCTAVGLLLCGLIGGVGIRSLPILHRSPAYPTKRRVDDNSSRVTAALLSTSASRWFSWSECTDWSEPFPGAVPRTSVAPW